MPAVGAQKWRHVAELQAGVVELLLHIVDELAHVHSDVVAVRERLGIPAPDCREDDFGSRPEEAGRITLVDSKTAADDLWPSPNVPTDLAASGSSHREPEGGT